MNTAAAKRPDQMSVADFLAWRGDGTDTRYELVDGILRAQDAASETHGTIQTRIAQMIANHLDAKRSGCRVVTAPGVQPRLRSKWNYRIPELGVTCSPNRADGHMIPDPILLIEILSPSNEEDTWSNIALYATLPSVTEILIVDARQVAAELLRRGSDGSWPQEPEAIALGGTIRLASVGFDMPLAKAYRDTHLAQTGV
jgi:Uma2 family endonuclease